jgi:hypothetical protein
MHLRWGQKVPKGVKYYEVMQKERGPQLLILTKEEQKVGPEATMKNKEHHFDFIGSESDWGIISIKEIPKTKADILEKIHDTYGGASPENLSCDGEASRASIIYTRNQIIRELKTLYLQYNGLKLTSEQVWAVANCNV